MSVKSYDPTFAAEVYAKVDSGEKIKTCMQCGVCAASCPLSLYMDYSPRKIFTLIRAGRREEVLKAKAIQLCTSCYSCKVRCPRNIPVVDVMHGLAHYSISLGNRPRHDSINFGRVFWNNMVKNGRVDESLVPTAYMLADGIGPGIKKLLDFKNMGLGLLMHKRMKPLPISPIAGAKELQKMLAKAREMKSGGAA